jgi:phosphate starvation-inducible PhoH-like protein
VTFAAEDVIRHELVQRIVAAYEKAALRHPDKPAGKP